MFELRDYQRDAIDAAIDHMKRRLSPVCLELATGCHSKGHPIMMADGTSKKVENVAVGDLVMGPDSKPRTVVRLHRGTDEMFNVEPTKGESFILNGGHILSLYKTPRRNGDIPGYTEVSVSDYLTKDKTFKHRHKLERLPVDLGSASVPVDPWFVGVMIGDGYIKGRTNYSICNPDIEILTLVDEYVKSIGGSVRWSKDHRNAHTLNFRSYKWLENNFKLLSLHGTGSGNKFIPDLYKFNSKEVRLDVIAGLIDTDGHLSRAGYDYISKSETLADDMVWLCRSVGLAAYKKQCQKSCQNNFTGTYYRVSISGDCSIIPCRVVRKKASPRRQVKNPLVTGFTVTPIGAGEYFGFELDGDHLYLDGNFVRHHNSGKSLVVAGIAEFLVKSSPNKRVLCLAPSKELVEQNHEKYTLWFEKPASLYSASTGRKELRNQVIYGSPMTVLNNIEKIARMGISGIIIDEAHGITDTIKAIVDGIRNYAINGDLINEKVRVVGMTATPYRTGTGYIYAADYTLEDVVHFDEDKAIEPYFARLAYRVTAGTLVQRGYLTPVVIGETGTSYDTSGLKLERGKFSNETVSLAFNGKRTKTLTIIEKVVEYSRDRMGVMIFAATISHAEEILAMLPEGDARIVTGKTKKSEREKIIADYKARKFKFLVNLDVLTTGFDASHVDLIAILRATESPGLLQQIIGRGVRLHPDKKDILLLDFAENISRHGLEKDIFTPIIETREITEASMISVECPLCHAVSQKKRRSDPAYENMKHNRFGNFLIEGTETAVRFNENNEPCEWTGAEMTVSVKDPSSTDDFGEPLKRVLPMPAHYSRRCSNPEHMVIKGVPVPCTHRFSLKICPECYAENDIAARHCTECKCRLVDPNEKLRETAGIANMMLDGEVRRVRCFRAEFAKFTSKKGRDSLKAEYHTEIGVVTGWTHIGKALFKRLAKENGTDPELITDYSQCEHWQMNPKSITVKKKISGDYTNFEIEGIHFNE